MPKRSPRFAVGDGVRFRYEGEEHWGRVTCRLPSGIRIRGADGRRFTTVKGQGRRIRAQDVRPAAFGVFVLDSQLDRSLYSDRQTADFWYRYCQSAGWAFGCERVHSLADLRYFLGRRRIREEVIVLSGHGQRRRGFLLSNGDRLDADTPLTIHRANVQKVFIVSSCEIGANRRLCRALVAKLRARALVVYTRPIRDDICFIVEPYLLQLIAARVPVERATAAMRQLAGALKTVNRRRAKKFPLEVFVPEVSSGALDRAS
jgi:hypothetical protein